MRSKYYDNILSTCQFLKIVRQIITFISHCIYGMLDYLLPIKCVFFKLDYNLNIGKCNATARQDIYLYYSKPIYLRSLNKLTRNNKDSGTILGNDRTH